MTVQAPAVAMTGLASERLAEHVVGLRFGDLPAEVVERAKDLITYDLGVAFAGRFTEAGRAAVALAHDLSAGGGSSTILGERRRATMLDAIFANSELMGLDDDHHLASKVRVGRVSQSAAWALGEHEHAPGREVITALVLAYDTACKLAEPQQMAGGYAHVPHKCAFAPFAPAAVAVRLLRYGQERAARSIARAAHFGMGLNAGLEDAFTFSLVARNGVMAALLPEANGTGILRAIDGPHGLYAALFGGPPEGLEASLSTLGREFSILGASTKRYPGSASHIAPLEAGRALYERERPEPDEVQSVVATLPDEFRGRFAYQETRMDRAAEPNDEDIAVGASLQLKLAILLVEGRVVPRPTLEHWRDPRVQAALPKVTLAFEPLPVDRARIELVTKDGRTLRADGAVVPYPKGDWSAWLRKDGERFLSEAKLARLERLITHLEDVDDFAEVMACVVPDRP